MFLHLNAFLQYVCILFQETHYTAISFGLLALIPYNKCSARQIQL